MELIMCYELSLKDTNEAKTTVFTANDNNIKGKIKLGKSEANVASMLSMLSLCASNPHTSLILNISSGNEFDFIRDLNAKNISIKSLS